MAVKSFTRGSSTYTCRCCGRTTRASRDPSEAGIELCAPCYELAGWENTLSDEGAKAVDLENVTDEFKDLLKKGVTEKKLEQTFPDLWALAMVKSEATALAATRTKYTYAEGMTDADKRKLRAAARKAVKKS